jgi:transcriptional regulator with XRE-family HTH domain
MTHASPGLKAMLRSSGSAIASIRKAEGYSQAQLAELTGVHPNTVANIERGLVDPSVMCLNYIYIQLRCLGIDVRDGGFSPIAPLPDDPSLPFPNLANISPGDMISVMGNRVVERRKAMGLSLKDLAGEAGVHPNTLWNFENGLVIPSASTIYSVYKALGVEQVLGCGDGIMLK